MENGNSQEIIRELRKQLIRTSVISLVVMFVVVIASIAWFVSNRNVSSDTSAIRSDYDSIIIASKGIRQQAEIDYLMLDGGMEYIYEGETYYYSSDGEIALHLSEEKAASPGASGEVTIYVIPTHDGAANIRLYLGLTGYKDIGQNGDTLVQRVFDPTLDAFLSGHILFFENYQDRQYSNWLYNDSIGGIINNTIDVSLPEDTQKGVPYPVTFYWIWPLRYENMVNDLYVKGNLEYQERFMPFVESQASLSSQINDTGYYYSRVFLAKDTELHDMDSRTKAYNMVDEYIGTNADYLYFTIETEAESD